MREWNQNYCFEVDTVANVTKTCRSDTTRDGRLNLSYTVRERDSVLKSHVYVYVCVQFRSLSF